jgi:PAS domain S-box-containing protein
MRILLVEDNSDHRELMRLALTGHDSTWEVEAVESGEETLRHLAEGEAYDVVFLDYSLPERDGLEVLGEIRRGEAPPPVVMVTGRGDERVAVEAMKGGAYDYVVKGEGYLQRLPVVARHALEANRLAMEGKQAEKALRESEERLRTIVEASLDAIIAVNVEGQLVLFNGAAQELFQYSKEEALNQPANILLREEIGKIHQERLERFLNTGVGRCGHIGRRVERFFRRKDGSLFEAEVSMSGGRLDGLRLVVLAIHDITSRKQAEEALHRAEENFRLSLDESPLGVRIVTAEGETIYANRAILDVYDIEDLKTTPVKKLYTPESFAEHQIRREKRKRGDYVPSEYDISIVRKDGDVRHLHVFRKEVLWNGEEQFQVIYQDITDRKQAEVQLHASLQEKEILLREIHHRVKNNMQVISGLLDLQASSSKNPELIAMFHESQNRIQAIALVHEKLYGSKDLARIDLAGYARTLSNELLQSYKINPGEIDLIVQTDDAVCVDINKAIPCGLILNELISNALKHAFPGDGSGELRVTIHETKNTEIEIIVRDNGMVLPDDVDIHQPRSVGLHLVNGLVKNQLDGQIEVRRDNGTEFWIKFPL